MRSVLTVASILMLVVSCSFLMDADSKRSSQTSLNIIITAVAHR